MSTSSRSWPLDLLRVFAALIVVVQHWGPLGVDIVVGDSPGRVVTGYGFMGVDIFFFISGLVITRSSVGRTTRQFAVSRFGRLAPAYLLVVTATLLVDAYVREPRLSLESVFSALTFSEFVAGTPSTHLIVLTAWTLWVEIQFYLVVALFLLLGYLPSVRARFTEFPSLLQLRWLYIGWLVLVCLDRSALFPLPALFELNGYAPVFLCGALFGTLRQPRDAIRIWPVLALSIALMWLAFDRRAVDGLNSFTAISTESMERIVATALVLLCLVTAFASMRVRPLPGKVASWLTLAAMATYPLYLLHQELGNRVAIYFNVNLGLSPQIAVGIAFIAVITASMLISAKFEPPARRWITRSLQP